jgi:lipoyl-dependent peroxiredoxin
MKIVEFERSAEIAWSGDVVRGSGLVSALTGAFEAPVVFPSLRGEPHGVTTPEELLAASHATCYAIGLRSVIGRRGGTASRIVVRATISARKGDGGIRIVRSHLSGIAYDVSGLDSAALSQCAEMAKNECTISNALAGNVEVTCELTSSPQPTPSFPPG